MSDVHCLLNLSWVLLCAGVVLLMQAGLTCLETGLARAKNSMNVAIKNVVDSGLIEKYVVSSKEQVATIRRAVATGDASARWQAAHALKSSSGMLGASTLAEWCCQLEALGRAATLERVPDVLSKLEAAYPTVCAALEEEVGKGD